MDSQAARNRFTATADNRLTATIAAVSLTALVAVSFTTGYVAAQPAAALALTHAYANVAATLARVPLEFWGFLALIPECLLLARCIHYGGPQAE